MSHWSPFASVRGPAARVLLVTMVLVVVAGVLLLILLPSGKVSSHDARPTDGSQITSPPEGTPVEQDPSAPLPDPGRLAATLRKLLVDPAFTGPANVEVVDAITGQVLLDQHAETAAEPASTAKLLIGAVALSVLGPDTRLPTRVFSDGKALYVVGGGDPTLAPDSARDAHPKPALLGDLARQVQAAHIRKADAVVGDGSLFTGPPTASGWRPYYLGTEAAPVTGLTLDSGRRRGEPVPSSRTMDPPLAAAEGFSRALAADHVTVGPARTGRAPAGARLVATVNSSPISELVEQMLTYSDNDIAEALGRLVAIRLGQPATFVGAAAALRTGLEQLGLPTDDLRMNDTSGLSHDDAVPPTLLVDVLRLAAEGQRPGLIAEITGLPVAGFTGTLADRYRTPDSRAGAGKVRAKSGRIMGVAALAGIVTTRDGRLLVFSARAPSTGFTAGELAMDRVAAALASCGCR